MADCADDRNIAPGDGTGEDLLIERPEVFHTAAAAGDDDNIDIPGAVEKIHSGSDLT